MVDILGCPGGVLFICEALLFGGLVISEMSSEHYSTVKVVAIIGEILFIWFSRVWYIIKVFVEEFVLVFRE